MASLERKGTTLHRIIINSSSFFTLFTYSLRLMKTQERIKNKRFCSSIYSVFPHLFMPSQDAICGHTDFHATLTQICTLLKLKKNQIILN